MSVSANFHSYVVDQLSGTGAIRSRRMFGGIGLYCDELFFGLLADDVLYFKVDASNRDDYTRRGCEAFRPFADEPDAISMSYFRIPEDVLEDVDELQQWARKSLAVAAAAAAVKAARKKRADRGTARSKKPSRATSSSTSSSRRRER